MLDPNLWDFEKVALRSKDSVPPPGTQSLASAKYSASPTFLRAYKQPSEQLKVGRSEAGVTLYKPLVAQMPEVCGRQLGHSPQ